MDVFSMRRRNLMVLIGRYGRQQALADAAGLSVQYVNQMLSGHRNIGEKTARKIEAALQLGFGWMDVDSSNSPAVVGDAVKIAAGDEVVNVGIDTLRLARAIQTLPAEKRAILQALVDSMSQGDVSGSVPLSKKAVEVKDVAMVQPLPSVCVVERSSGNPHRPGGRRP
jgi:transcriptional regulator with XRE-family HTH domain